MLPTWEGAEVKHFQDPKPGAKLAQILQLCSLNPSFPAAEEGWKGGNNITDTLTPSRARLPQRREGGGAAVWGLLTTGPVGEKTPSAAPDSPHSRHTRDPGACPGARRSLSRSCLGDTRTAWASAAQTAAWCQRGAGRQLGRRGVRGHGLLHPSPSPASSRSPTHVLSVS